LCQRQSPLSPARLKSLHKTLSLNPLADSCWCWCAVLLHEKGESPRHPPPSASTLNEQRQSVRPWRLTDDLHRNYKVNPPSLPSIASPQGGGNKEKNGSVASHDRASTKERRETSPANITRAMQQTTQHHRLLLLLSSREERLKESLSSSFFLFFPVILVIKWEQ
jgi:hypothetical protein